MSLQELILRNVPLPDSLYRFGIKKELKDRLKRESYNYENKTIEDYVRFLSSEPIAVNMEDANEQHYEVPVTFFDKVMGGHKKYSCCLFETGKETLDEAEEAMLELTCKRANLSDHQDILELGCGWGSLTLFMAKKYPHSRITAVSNSHSQRDFIETQLNVLGLHNVVVITENVAALQLSQRYDRIVSVEMMEHIRNYNNMFEKLSDWLNPSGEVFIHVFAHKDKPYIFDDKETKSWMANHIFSGGQMPSKALFSHFNKALHLKKIWVVSGMHYAQTCMKWLDNMDRSKALIMPIFEATYRREAATFWIYWRLFFMACEELFAYNKGEEWQVYHYRFQKV